MKYILIVLASFFIFSTSACSNEVKNKKQPLGLEELSTPIVEFTSEAPISASTEVIKENLYRVVKTNDYSTKFEWLTENSFRYQSESTNKDLCLLNSYVEVSINEFDNHFALQEDNRYTVLECSPNPYGGSFEYLPILSPSQQYALIKTTTDKPNSPISIEMDKLSDQNLFYQYLLLSTKTGKINSLVSTPLNYLIEWLPNDKQIMFTGLCYGSFLGSGIYILDINTQEVNTLSKDFAYCEYGIKNQVSPDSQFIIINGSLQSMEGGDLINICQTDEVAWAQTWANDSKNAYAFCHKLNNEGGILRSINVETRTVKSDLIDSDQLIQAVNIAVSPDQKWLLFEWGNSIAKNTENLGVFLVRMNK